MNLLGLFNRKPKSQPVTTKDLREMEQRMSTKLSELAGALTTVNEQIEKAAKEITDAIKKLEDQLANGEISEAAEEALAALKTKVQKLDDLNPDVPA